MKIICIGMNYLAHIAEMGAPAPAEPVFFMKPDTALLRDNDSFYVPDFMGCIEYECEIVVRINRVCKAIEPQFAHRCYSEIGLGIDFTARDLQRSCKECGLPWEISKAFDHSAVVGGPFLDASALNMTDIPFELLIDNQVRQSGNSRDMLFSIDQIISHVSQFITLRTGDFIFTGTPCGVGAVEAGQQMRGVLNGVEMFNFSVH